MMEVDGSRKRDQAAKKQVNPAVVSFLFTAFSGRLDSGLQQVAARLKWRILECQT